MSSADAPPSPDALSLTAAADAIAAGRITARTLAEAQLARIAATDAGVEAWAALDAAHVRAEAERCDASAALAPLHGIGVGVKDIIATRALATQMGSPVFAGHRDSVDAACVARILEAGGYVFGKTVTTEFAFMHPGKTRNPWNAAHTPGGSSSGSAAAVAAGQVNAAIGTQTNGSVIRPAAYCGVVGFKPTLGAIPYDGANLFSATFDTIGTFTRTVDDAARLAGALLYPRRRDPLRASCEIAPRLAYLREFPWTRSDRAAADVLDAAVERLRQSGAAVDIVTLPREWHDAHVAHRTIMLHEGARNLGALQARARAGLSAQLNAALDEGRAIGEESYQAALAQRRRLIDAFVEWSGKFAAIVAPAAPAGAPAGLDTTGDPSCCTLWSLLGVPAITLPIDRDALGLPLGLQLAARAGDDARLLAVAGWCESRCGSGFQPDAAMAG